MTSFHPTGPAENYHFPADPVRTPAQLSPRKMPAENHAGWTLEPQRRVPVLLAKPSSRRSQPEPVRFSGFQKEHVAPAAADFPPVLTSATIPQPAGPKAARPAVVKT